MGSVVIQSVTRQYGTQVVLEDVSLELQTGETVGLVGANGAGKTTLFRLIAGELQPDLGTVTRSRGLEIGYLKQEPEILPERTVRDEVASVFEPLLALERKLHVLSEQIAAHAESDQLEDLLKQYERVNAQFEAAGGHTFETRLHEILGGLGFPPEEYETPTAVLSGGQKCRVALAKLLLQDRELLLLDEPTNHLDIDAVRWLEKFLAGHHGGAVIISHDRYLLDRLCDRIVEVERRKVYNYPGNYTNYVKTRKLRELSLQRQYEKDQAFIAKEREYYARYHAAERGKQAKGRLTRLERGLRDGEFVTKAPTSRRTIHLRFEEVEAKGGVVLRAEDLAMAYGEKRLFEGLTFSVQAGEAFAITGPNGTGKSTLLKILLGQLQPVAGTVKYDSKRSIGYYAQEPAELDPNRSVLDEILAARPDFTAQEARSLLGRYLFTGDDVFKPLGKLSGGEQSRVRLATLILQAPEVLVLDEPTNHLDIPSREALEEQLLEFEGAIIVVSHDRYFLDRIADRLMVMRREGCRIFHGNYSDYIETIEREQAAAERQAAERAAAERKARRANGSKPRRERGPYDHLTFEEIEAEIIGRETLLAELSEQFGDPELYKDVEALNSLKARMEQARAELAALNAEWEQRAAEQ
ncbi:MAG TPA: ABC-F family ATP-binding cassette domain-containing protein [Phycisphaerae bacterium]|jgi:ATP-binding cassette subfamily F protein 3|nr:ABC-F family ATP-binding cassette domain-containing protein [Phycisphaerae bacterium]HOB76617.1 ABC-F family ATP-binding cassette domain-containing protein [Phycisphaerae bacterium]HOJ56081.1 ABC-F family ATP-binding cassette domain-containing protein [Phycisphaerae bacterium]HOL28384.1 ABC-F family ATP-binding cassette domain-containing protein [Phycisphaerae bacterium]HPP22855.1 ABC-F family ATP-binding cassette domain-containing protein [Phycisphaerae bacterium]